MYEVNSDAPAFKVGDKVWFGCRVGALQLWFGNEQRRCLVWVEELGRSFYGEASELQRFS